MVKRLSDFKTDKIKSGWATGVPLGSVAYISGGVSLPRVIEWYSNKMVVKDGKRQNDTSVSFVIGLNGDIVNLIDLSKKEHGVHKYSDIAIGITFVNAGLLRKRDGDFYWHPNNWGLKYPLNHLKPVHIRENIYHQPLTREQIEAFIYLSKELKSSYPGFKPLIIDTKTSLMFDKKRILSQISCREDASKLKEMFPSFRGD